MTQKAITILVGAFLVSIASGHNETEKLFFAKIGTKNKTERTLVSEAGVAIDGILSDGVTSIATEKEIKKLKKLGLPVEIVAINPGEWSFPAGDEAFHDFAETNAVLETLEKDFPKIAKRFSIGKSVEGRNLAGIRLSSNPVADSLPTMVFVGCHHAREHLSVELPLMIAQHLTSEYGRDSRITQLLDTREIWIVPMLNPDGAEYDIASSNYRMWRKNRRDNGDGTRGVDLNRNYAKGWGGSGSSGSTDSDIYRGKSAFSEPETAAVRDFVRLRPKTRVLLSFHTFSELILWPWGHTYDKVPNVKDRTVFETMGKKMAEWNHYTPQKASDLYLASGDTTDWAYDELGIFAFTFELSPDSIFGGGFYPGAEAIQPTFEANLEPALYLIEKAADPYSAITETNDPIGIL